MARKTNSNLRNQIIYSVYIRNHTQEGTFNAFAKDLDRIKALGTDIIWLMPVHPIGQKNKKGTLGCPYAISDFRKINPEYGTIEDFENLVSEIHKREMKVIIDVVYAHTSYDAWLFDNHKEFYYKMPNGSYGCKIGDWSDIIDLDYNNRELWDYQLDTLKMWAEYVDGFRCDVAACVPVSFWKIARAEINNKKPNFFWLAESVDSNFIKEFRDKGYNIHSDSELYEVFDCCYDYDVKEYYEGYLNGTVSLKQYVWLLNRQEVIYPKNYIKMRFLENHDTPRIVSKLTTSEQLFNHTAFMYFQKGMPMIYAGQENQESKAPSLFEKDAVNWNKNKDISKFMQNLSKIKKLPIMATGAYSLEADEKNNVIIGYLKEKEETLVGIFSLKNASSNIIISIQDGTYTNLISNIDFSVKNSNIDTKNLPIIFKI